MKRYFIDIKSRDKQIHVFYVFNNKDTFIKLLMHIIEKESDYLKIDDFGIQYGGDYD